MFVTMVTIIASANMFGQSFIMTKGAPGQETRTAIYYIAETGLQNFQMGSAAAASWMLTLALMLLSVVVFALFREREGSRVMRPRGSLPRYILLGLLTLAFVSPLLLMVSTSFKTRQESAQSPPTWFPHAPTLDAYRSILSAADTPVFRWFGELDGRGDARTR